MTVTELIEKLSAIKQVYGGQIEVFVMDEREEDVAPEPHYVSPQRDRFSGREWPAKVTL